MPAYYSFLPYIRQGLASLIGHNDFTTIGDRVNVDVNVAIKGNGSIINPSSSSPANSVTQTISLKGPGDIIGINRSQIIRVSPRDGALKYEPNYLPFIEFYDEDLPWRYTPAKAVHGTGNNYKLRPWMSLIVLADGEYNEGVFKGILPSIRVIQNLLPPNDQTWGWAHVHVNGDLPSSALSNLKQNLPADNDRVISRIICPRKLDPFKRYNCFLVPTFELGRKAGLNIVPTGNALQASWDHTLSTEQELPYYYRWAFSTGEEGDFEFLLKKIRPLAIHPDVGKREMDLQLPGNPVLDNTSVPDTVDLRAVLHPVGATEDTDWPGSGDDFVSTLKDILNQPTVLLKGGAVDPIVGPPVYGRWHAAINPDVNGNLLLPSSGMLTNWIYNANLDPRYRVYAGIGAEVVRRNQDKYMQIAWEQIGEVLEANRKIREMQLALQASCTLYERNIATTYAGDATLSDELIINISGNAHARIGIPVSSATETVYKMVGDSVLPNSMFSGAFRRITRPASVLMVSMDDGSGTVSTSGMMAALNSGTVSIGMPASTPTSMSAMSAPTTAPFNIANFNFSSPGSAIPVNVGGAPSPAATAFLGAALSLNSTLASSPTYTFNVGPALDISGIATDIRTKLEPNDNMLTAAQNQVYYVDDNGAPTQSVSSIDFVLAAPQIQTPMYKELAKLSTDWIMPGLDKIPKNTVSLLQVSQKYIESFMLGANHEMARELLWRGYPTDQRGTCFSFFWGFADGPYPMSLTDAALEEAKDIWPINQWRIYNNLGSTPPPTSGPLSALGANSRRTRTNPDLLILTIRGDLLEKYPGTIIYMQQAEWHNSTTRVAPRKLKTSNPNILYPVFSAKLDPDIYFIAFDITAADAKGTFADASNAGYFFVFEENTSEIRFGADIGGSSSPSLSNWNDIGWNTLNTTNQTLYSNSGGTAKYISVANLGQITASSNPDSLVWAENSASMAYALMQMPVRMAVHADDFIAGL